MFLFLIFTCFFPLRPESLVVRPEGCCSSCYLPTQRSAPSLQDFLCPPMPGPLSNVLCLELGTNSVISDFHFMHCCVCVQPLLVTSSAGGMKAQTEPGTAPNLALHLLNSCGTGAGSGGEDAPGQEGHRARTVLSEHPSSSSARNSVLQVLSSCCAGSRDCWNVKHSAPSHPHRNPATAALVCSARCL